MSKKNRNPRRASDDDSGVTETPEDAAEVLTDSAPTVSPAALEPPKPAPKKVKKVAQVVSLAEREFTIDMFARTKRGEGDLITAFASVTKSNEGIVKRTIAEWNEIYTRWLKAPR